MASPRSSQPRSYVAKLIGSLPFGRARRRLLLPFVGGLGLAAKHEADKFLDQPCNLQETPPPQKTILYASDGKTLIAELSSRTASRSR